MSAGGYGYSIEWSGDQKRHFELMDRARSMGWSLCGEGPSDTWIVPPDGGPWIRYRDDGQLEDLILRDIDNYRRRESARAIGA